MRENKLVVLGAGGVGKTSLIVQFLEGFFSFTYKPTVEDCYRHTVQTPDGLFHTVEILDTAGSHHFPAMRELSIRSGRGFVLVFSVDSLQSFHEAVQLWHLIVKIRGEHVPIVLVGNKSDLIAKRQVSQDMAIKLAQDSMHSCQYLETSAKYNVNVSELFVELLQQTYDMEQQQLPGSSCPSTPGPSESCDSPQRKPSRKLSRRLGSLGNLPSIRRKSSAASSTGPPPTPRTVVRQASEPLIDEDQKCNIL
ncbi:ras-related protein Rap-1b-like [Ornithodoros turicata]|uniref:ras-related protein Rap-1b-like n=1 Tax=Ornithodoros turicata TaxID=34597 RepID=UPI00313A122D